MNRKTRQKIAKKRIKQYADQSRNLALGKRNRIPMTHSRRGMIVFGISLAMILLYAALLGAELMLGEKFSLYLGSVGVLAMAVSFIALIEALISRKERHSFPLFPRLAAVSAFLACVCWIGTYVLGWCMTNS